MIDINELRRLAQAATPGPWHATKSVETNSWAVWSDTTRLMELRPTKTVDMYQVSNTAAFIAAVNPAAIVELLDRLEAAESDGLEQARLLGMSGEREAALLSKIEATEKERDNARELADTLALALNTSNHERANLRAKIAQMEKQEPVATVYYKAGNCIRWVEYLGWQKLKDGTNLYALPVAQPAPSVPDGWQLVPIEPTQEMLIAGQSEWLESAGADPCFYVYRAMLAAAPEVKP